MSTGTSPHMKEHKVGKAQAAACGHTSAASRPLGQSNAGRPQCCESGHLEACTEEGQCASHTDFLVTCLIAQLLNMMPQHAVCSMQTLYRCFRNMHASSLFRSEQAKLLNLRHDDLCLVS